MPARQTPPPRQQQHAPVQHQAPPPPAVAQPRQPGMFAQSKFTVKISLIRIIPTYTI